MAFNEALQETIDVLRTHPELFAFALFVSAIPVLLGSVTGGLLNFAITPFLIAGMYGVVAATHSGKSPTKDQFIESGKEHYASMFGAIIVMAIALFPITFIGVTGVSLAYVFSPIMTVAAGTLAVLGVLVALVSLQFFDVVIVVEEVGLSEAFEKSWRIFTQNGTEVLMYSIIRGSLFAIMLAVPVLVALVVSEGSIAVAITGPIPQIVSIFSSTLIGAFLYVYHTIFYRAIS